MKVEVSKNFIATLYPTIKRKWDKKFKTNLYDADPKQRKIINNIAFFVVDSHKA